MVRNVSLKSVHILDTMDNDLFGTRETDNQAKKLSARKLEMEGHKADDICDASFRVKWAIINNNRDQNQFECVTKLICELID